MGNNVWNPYSSPCTMYLRTLVNLASLRPGGPLTLNRGYTAFSSVRTPKDLPPWNIWYDGDLVPTDSHEARLAASIAQGSSQNPTLRDLHQQLNSQREFLRGRVRYVTWLRCSAFHRSNFQTEHRSRAVTDAIIEHTRVMLLDRCPMGLILEDRLPEVTVAPLNKHAEVRTLTGSADYLCTIPPIPDNTKTAADYNSEDFEALFPIEAKTRNIHLRFPHLVLEMYARALHRPRYVPPHCPYFLFLNVYPARESFAVPSLPGMNGCS